MQKGITHFEALVEHLGAFDQGEREHLAELYGAEAADPQVIARQWLEEPEAVADLLESRVGQPEAWQVLEHLVQEHDLPIDVEWIDASIRRELTELGIVKPSSPLSIEPDVDWVPGAVAAILAPKLAGTRPTIPVLLGRFERDEIDAIAEEYGISTHGSKVEVVLRVSEAFSEPGFVDRVLDRLPHPDWVGGAMMILELGGLCYWREIFGRELEGAEPEDDDNVVPLMRSEERDEQRRIAERLLELGIVYRIEEQQSEFPLVAVPEELWFDLWSLGQNWLVDWSRLAFSDLEDVAVRQPHEDVGWSAQPVLKWMACESRGGRLELEGDRLRPEVTERLDELSPGLDIDWEPVVTLGRDLRILEKSGETLVLEEHAPEFLDLSRAAFVREVLSNWAIGIVGTRADRPLPRAVGLDERWRRHLVDYYSDRPEAISPWMNYEGIDPMETGAGCLREVHEGDGDFLVLEHGLINAFFCITKVHWLDLLSLLDTNAWYSAEGLRELLQMVASYGLFSQLGHIVEDPHSNYYFPVQRPSFMTLPAHTEAFSDWLGAIIGGIFEPLGIAQISDDGERVWLDTRHVRVPTPPEWPEQPRLDLVRHILDDPDADFSLPDTTGAALHSVPEGEDGDVVSLDLALPAILSACQDRDIERFDGERLYLKKK